MAEQVEPVQPERLPHRCDLLYEGVHDPQGHIIGLVGVPAAELVVEDHRPPVISEPSKVLEVVMR